jgi:hypothetical protein
MAQIALIIPDAQLARVITAISVTHQYSATLPNGDPNPQTEAQFAKQQIANWVKNVVTRYESEQAAVNNDINVT